MGLGERRSGMTDLQAFFAGVGGFVLLVMLGMLVVYFLPHSHPPLSSTATRMPSLRHGAELYRKKNGYYPGQRQSDKLVSKGGKYTGSELMAMAMYLVELAPDGPEGELRGGYDTYREEHIIRNYAGHPYTLSDYYRGKEAMAICYYVPRPDKEGLDRYVEADNAVYTDRAKGGDFRAFITRRCTREGKLYMPDFLLIAPGPDRKYFTADDITNF